MSAYRFHAHYALQSDEIECQEPLADSVIAEARPYPCDEKPVFMGHYWLPPLRGQRGWPRTSPVSITALPKVGSFAGTDGRGEQKVDNEHFVGFEMR
jgi:hypothetical protein